MSTKIHTKPAEKHGARAEAAACQQEKGAVLQVVVVRVVDVQKDPEPAHPHEHRDDGEDVPVAEVVRETGDY
jgi:hypothetical protein